MRDIFVVFTVLALTPVSFARPWIGVLVFSWLGYMNPHKLSWGFAREMPLAMLIGVATLAGLLITKEKKRIPWTPELAIMVVMFALFTLTSFFAWAPAAAWEQWDKVMKIMLMTLVSTMLIYGRAKIHALILVIALSIGFYGTKGGYFTLTHGGQFSVLGPEGTFISGNTSIGVAMIMVLPLLVFLGRVEPRKWLRRGLYVMAGLTTLSIVFTYSRGALLGLGAILPLIFLKTNKKILAIAILLPLAYFGKDLVPEALYSRAETIQTFEQDSSSMQRLQAWSVAYNIAKSHPFVGAGFNFEESSDERWLSYADFMVENGTNVARAAHSIYFQVLGQHGFIAVVLFVVMLLLTLWRLQKIKRAMAKGANAWIGSYASMIQIALIGYMVAGAFLSLAYFDLLYAYVGLAAMLQREAASGAKAEVAAVQTADASRVAGRGRDLEGSTQRFPALSK